MKKKQGFVIYAPFWKRVIAHNSDLVILLIIWYASSALIDTDIIFYFICLFQYLIYHIAFELSNWKATPGKKLAKIRIRELKHGYTLSVVLRNIFKVLSIAPVFLGYTIALFSKKRQALHDILSSCVVIEEV